MGFKGNLDAFSGGQSSAQRTSIGLRRVQPRGFFLTSCEEVFVSQQTRARACILFRPAKQKLSRLEQINRHEQAGDAPPRRQREVRAQQRVVRAQHAGSSKQKLKTSRQLAFGSSRRETHTTTEAERKEAKPWGEVSGRARASPSSMRTTSTGGSCAAARNVLRLPTSTWSTSQNSDLRYVGIAQVKPKRQGTDHSLSLSLLTNNSSSGGCIAGTPSCRWASSS